MLAPLERRRTVFTSGSSKGLTVAIPIGGHCVPISTVGLSLEWKNLQNTLRKKNTSLMINRITLIEIPFCTT